MIDPKLKEWASPLLRDRIDAVNRLGSVAKATREMSFCERAFYRDLVRIKARAAKAGYETMGGVVPEGYMVKGTSTLYKGGDAKLQWVKTAIDPEKQKELLAEAIKAFNSHIKREPKAFSPKKTLEDLLNVYVLTDYHLGMLSWGEETGDDWDMAIAEDLVVQWFRCAINSSPNSETAILAQLGDFLHFDGLDAVTPAHHNLLDADTRFQKVVRTAIRILRRIVRMLLEKHKKVHVIMAEGNHDPASSIWLREWLHALYDQEPRITVDLSPDPYYCYEHGDTSLFFHHGHKRKPASIDDVFVAKYRDIFGRTKHSYAHMGHMHHIDTRETPLMIVEQHRTLAAADAYTSRGGFMSGRDAKVITYSKKYGEVARVTINPDMARG